MASPQQTNFLPRSLIWRLRLGLLKSPSEMALEDVIRHNTELLQEEQSHYEKLQATYKDHLTKTTTRIDPNADNSEDEAEEEELEELPPELDPLQATTSSEAAALDPLTAMLQEQQAQEDRRQELDLRYRKERARRKRGLATDAKVVVADCDEGQAPKSLDSDTLNVIDKDLHRLPSPEISDFEGVSIKWGTEEQREAWIEALREILYLFSQENSHIGYRQGMHEVASYLWVALDIDRKRMQQKMTEVNTEMQIQMQEQSSMLFGRAAAYTMLRSMLGNIRQAFDVKVASNSRPLEDMSHAILAKIKQQHNYYGLQDKLTPLLISLSVPPQLYCTKWIRLLFSREVIGAQNVIILWDVFIELVSEGWEWMAVLETTAASRILLCRDQLLDKSMPDYSQPAHHHLAMDLLMNMPAMENIEPLVVRLNGLLELQKYTQFTAPVLKQDETIHNQPFFTNETVGGPNSGGFSSFGDDISAVFSMKSVRQSLEEGVGRLSSSKDTWKKKLVNEWNGMKQHQTPTPDLHQTSSASPTQRSYMMDAALFGDDEVQARQQQQQQQHLPASAPHSTTNHVNGPTSLPSTPNVGHSQELAYRLGKSGAVLQEFVMSVARGQATSNEGDPSGVAPKVPNVVWEALAEVETIRSVLLQQV